MSDKKNIDRLFQEKFKDFEAAPPEFIWENIKEVLEEKKKKRVIPLWLRLGGVAAVIALFMLLGNFYLNGWNGDATQNPAVTTTPDGATKQPLQALPTDIKEGENVIDRRDNPPININDAVVNGDGKGQAKGSRNSGVFNNNANDKTPSGKANPIYSTKNDALVNQSSNNTNNQNGKTRAKYDSAQPDNAIVNNNTTSAKNKATAKGKGIKANTNNIVQQGTAVANNNSGVNNSTGKSNPTTNNNIVAKANAAVTQNNLDRNKAAINNNGNNATQNKQPNTAVANNGNSAFSGNNSNTSGNNSKITNSNNGITQPKDAVAGGIKPSTNNPQDNNKSTIINDPKPDSNTAVADKNSDENATDTNPAIIDTNVPVTDNPVAETVIDTTAATENELEKLLKEQEKDKKEDKDKVLADNSNKTKWNIKPQLAPIFYNSLSNGSPIDGQFASNAKSYDNELSMGLGINYAVSKKISIRSGINTVNLNYATQGVEFYASLNQQTNNVAARTSNANIVVQDQGTSNSPAVFFADKLPTETFNGSMVQKTGYVEVPVEMSYALLNKKFGIDIIGGVSTLFLNQNNVSVVSSQGYSTDVGKAENLNNIHFSTNVGLGFKYRFFKAFEANFEPMFKYQVNTFSRDAGNFKPYFIGLYSGISFSF